MDQSDDLSARRTTIDDVAKAAGVSIKTVSRVLNQEPNVRSVTRDKVLAAVHELNYHPSHSARSLASRRSYVIGLIYNNPSANYIFDIQTGAMSRCREDRFQLIIQDCKHTPEEISRNAIGLIDQTHADGLILSAPICDEPRLLDMLHDRQIPYVSISPGEGPHRASYSYMDDRAASREMTEHMIGLGHRRIGIILGHPDHYSAMQRQLGFADAMGDHQLPMPPDLAVQGYYDFDSGHGAARALLKRADRPTALIACNDDMAAGAIMAAHELGLEVPRDLSVSGFDDTYISRVLWPRLTTVHQPIYDMARAATDQLIRQLQGGAKSHSVKIDYRLVLRDSTGPAPTR